MKHIYINIYLLFTSYICSYLLCVIHAYVISAHAFFFNKISHIIGRHNTCWLFDFVEWLSLLFFSLTFRSTKSQNTTKISSSFLTQCDVTGLLRDVNRPDWIQCRHLVDNNGNNTRTQELLWRFYYRFYTLHNRYMTDKLCNSVRTICGTNLVCNGIK